MRISDISKFSGETLVTEPFAYLLQQVEETLDLASYVFQRFEQSDKRKWQLPSEVASDTETGAETVFESFRNSELTLSRKHTFSYLVLCQIYNAFDTYIERVLDYAPQRYKNPNKSCSQLDKYIYDLTRNGLSFLQLPGEYQQACLIRDCRNLITHNHGVIHQKFHRAHPSLPPGEGKRLILYYLDIVDYTVFLMQACFVLDQSSYNIFALQQKPFGEWHQPYQDAERV